MDSQQIKIEEEYCNGGAIALKGFNYQHAVASFIIISNYKKDDFCIYLETKDDIEVELESKHVFIQVKGQKLSINTLTKADAKSKKSILSKSLSNNSTKEVRYKIITTTNFAEKDKNKFLKTTDGFLFQEIHQYSEEQKKEILDALSNQGLSQEEIKQKLEKSYVYFSPFINNLEQAETVLLGLMNKSGINIDNQRGQRVLNELLKFIAQKSEKTVKCDGDREQKTISSHYCEKLFKSSRFAKARVELAEELKAKDVIDFNEYDGIKRALCEIDIKHNALRLEVKKVVADFVIKDAITTIQKLYDELSVVFISLKKTLLYGLIIDLYISKLEDDYNDN